MKVDTSIGSPLLGSLSIRSEGSLRKRARFAVPGGSAVAVPSLLPVTITADGVPIFDGFIERAEANRTSPVTSEIDYTCVDKRKLVDDRVLKRTYVAQPAADIVLDIIDQIGMQAGTVVGNGIWAGPFNFMFRRANTCLDDVARSVGAEWGVDIEGRVHFGPRTEATDTLNGRISKIAQSAAEHFTRIWIKNVPDVYGPFEALGLQPEIDGLVREFFLSEELQVTPIIYTERGEDFAEETCAVRDGGIPAQWYWSPGTSRIEQDESEDILQVGDSLHVFFYRARVVTVVRGSGDIERVVDNTGVSSIAEAQRLGDAMLTYHSQVPTNTTYKGLGYVNAGGAVTEVRLADKKGVLFYEATVSSTGSATAPYAFFDTWLDGDKRVPLIDADPLSVIYGVVYERYIPYLDVLPGAFVGLAVVE